MRNNPITRFIFPTVILAISLFLTQKPYYNWDMFPYMALALNDETRPFDSTHNKVYRIAKASMPPHDFEAIASRQPMLRESPDAFKQILKYFTIKPGYNIVVSLLVRLGVNPVMATYLPSVFSYLIVGYLLLWWTGKAGPQLLSGLFTMVILLAPPVINLARYSSPDMLCAMVSLVGFILLIQKQSRAGLLVLFIAIWVRPDGGILMVLVAASLAAAGSIRWQAAAIAATLGLLSVGYLVFNNTLVDEYLLLDIGFDMRMSAYADGLGGLLRSFTLPALGFGLIVLYFRRQKPIADDLILLTVAAMVSIVIRYLLHPFAEDRFHLPAYLLMLLVFWETMKEHGHSKTLV